MSTEQATGVSCWLALAASVMREEPASLRYFSFNGFCVRKNSACLSKSSPLRFTVTLSESTAQVKPQAA